MNKQIRTIMDKLSIVSLILEASMAAGVFFYTVHHM